MLNNNRASLLILISWMGSYILASYLARLFTNIILKTLVYQYTITIIPLGIILWLVIQGNGANVKFLMRSAGYNTKDLIKTNGLKLVGLAVIASFIVLVSVLFTFNNQWLLSLLLLPNALVLTPILVSLVFVDAMPKSLINLYQLITNNITYPKQVVILAVIFSAFIFALLYYQMTPAIGSVTGIMVGYLVIGCFMQYIYLQTNNILAPSMLFSLFQLITIWF